MLGLTRIVRQRGATLVEFTLAVTLVLLPLALLTLQIALLGVTRRVLDVAVVMAVRAGAADHGSTATMRLELARAMQPLHVTARMHASGDFRPAAAAAIAEVARPDHVALQILSPRVAAGARENPNEGFDRRPGADAARNAALLRDNLLTVDLRYCAPMIVPVAASMLAAVLRTDADDPFAARCFQQQRMPMRVRNTQVMQSSFRGG